MTGDKLVHTSFRVGVLLKGLNGALEIVGGLLLVCFSPATVSRLIIALTQHEILEDPHDLIASHLFAFAQQYSVSSQLFGVFYLLSHGVIKLFLAESLWRNRRWAYPAAMWFFVLFIIYQVYRYQHTHSLGLVLLTILDVGIVWLTWLEYKRTQPAM